MVDCTADWLRERHIKRYDWYIRSTWSVLLSGNRTPSGHADSVNGNIIYGIDLGSDFLSSKKRHIYHRTGSLVCYGCCPRNSWNDDGAVN